MSKGPTAADRPGRQPSSLTLVQMVLVALLIGLQVIPRLLFTSSPELISSVDGRFSWAMAGTAVVLSQSVWWGLFGTGAWRTGHRTAKIAIVVFSILFSALYALMFSLLAAPLFGFYELQHLPSERREMLYAVELVSDAGRGGPRAYANPYGLGRLSLPLSQTDFHAFTSGRFTWKGLVCYRVIELRRGDVVGIVKPSQRDMPNGALTRCSKPDPRVVVHDTDRR